MVEKHENNPYNFSFYKDKVTEHLSCLPAHCHKYRKVRNSTGSTHCKLNEPNKRSGLGCSKLTMSLVNISLKFQMLISIICHYFLMKKCEKLLQCCTHFCNKKYQCVWLQSRKTLNQLTSQPACYANNALRNRAQLFKCFKNL